MAFPKAFEVARNQFSNEKAPSTRRQGMALMYSTSRSLAAMREQKLSQLVGNSRVDRGQFGSQLVALGPDPIIDELTPLVLFLRLHLFEANPSHQVNHAIA